MTSALLLFVLLAAAETPVPKLDPRGYRIGVEDVLVVNVWKEPEISRRVTVRPDGKISLPLLNDFSAADRTPAELASELAQAFRKFLTEADVTVIVEQVNSKKFYVLGEVAHPGAFPLLQPTTVLQAITAAGGFKEFANTRKVQVLRGARRLPFNYAALVEGKNADHNIALEPGDTVVVP